MEVSKRLTTDETEKIYLSLLPNEILLQIFRMLPPLSLVALGKIDHRFSTLTFDRLALKSINFSNCSSLSITDLSEFFVPTRAAFISELNFNGCRWIGSELLENCVGRCQQMRTLSVMNCALTLNSLYRIMMRLKHLNNLSWTVSIDNTKDKYNKKEKMALKEALNNLKKVDFEFTGKNFVSCFFVLWDEFLSSCNNLQKLVVNFTAKISLESFATDDFMKRSVILNSFDSLTVTCNSEFLSPSLFYSYKIECLTKLLYKAKAPGKKWKNLWIDYNLRFCPDFAVVNNRAFEDFNRVECLQINCAEGISATVKILEIVPAHSVHELGICQSELLETNKVIAACGKKLKRLVLYKCAQDVPQAILTDLQDLFTSCSNITMLNIEGAHFGDAVESPCIAICNLKNLQRVILPSCAVKSVARQQTEELSHMCNNPRKKSKPSNPFKDMVESCKFVKELRLQGCFHSFCFTRCIDNDIEAIYLWEKLEYLLLEFLPKLQNCKFLEKIAVECKSFRTLYIKNIGNPSECHYLPSLNFLLVNAPRLSSLKIAGSSVDFRCNSIWHSISCGKNLERICLFTEYLAEYKPTIIVNSVSQLPKLRTFHFFFRKLGLASKVFDTACAIKKYFESRTCHGNSKEDNEFAFGWSESHECHFANE